MTSYSKAMRLTKNKVKVEAIDKIFKTLNSMGSLFGDHVKNTSRTHPSLRSKSS